MAAGQNARFKVQLLLPESLDHLKRILLREGQIVVGIDDQNFFVESGNLFAGNLIVIADGADGGPEDAQPLLRKARFYQSLANVARTLPVPDHVTE